MRLNHVRVIPGRGCVCGVVGCDLLQGLPPLPALMVVLAEVTWDGAPEWVRAPVRESMIVVWWIVSRVAAGSWNLL